MIKPKLNSHIQKMIKKSNLIFFLLFFLVAHCSFDSKTGIWGGSEKEREKLSELEKKQKDILNIDKIYSSKNIYSKEVLIQKNIDLSKPKKNSSWMMTNYNYQNSPGHLFLPSANDVFFKKKVGKNKFSISKNLTSLLHYNNNLIFSDDRGNIFSLNANGKINWKKNIYKKVFKNIYKNLAFAIYEDKIYVSDNIGLIYSLNVNNGKIIWVKNYGVSLKSNIKVFDNKIFLIDQDNKIICLNADDGTKIWDVLSISSFIKTQNLMSIALTKKGDLIAINSAADLFRIKGSTGNIYWSSNTSSSLLADATDFFSSSEIALSDKEAIFSAESSIFSYNINNGSINWEKQIASTILPIINGENIFLVTKNGFFVILNRITGDVISSTNILKVLKSKKQNTKVTGFIMGSGKIYSVTLNGYLIVASASSGKVESFKKIGDPITSSPIIVNGKLYILTDDSKIFGFK